MKFQVGDRVRKTSGDHAYYYADKPAEVILAGTMTGRYYIKYLTLPDTKGDFSKNWVHENHLEYDKEYYREYKLNILLDEENKD